MDAVASFFPQRESPLQTTSHQSRCFLAGEFLKRQGVKQDSHGCRQMVFLVLRVSLLTADFLTPTMIQAQGATYRTESGAHSVGRIELCAPVRNAGLIEMSLKFAQFLKSEGCVLRMRRG